MPLLRSLRPPAPHAARRWSRLPQAALLALLALGSMGAADPAVRYNELGHQMMCVCSCAQVLIECNHVGCPDSDSMLHLLRASVSRGDSDRSILEAFQAKYGPTVLASPLLTPFNKVAWIVPPAVLAFGLVGLVALIRRWRNTHAPAPAHAPQPGAARDRVRRETEL
ncbi:MAG TPA: cytochrome c-type biogenesis protein CcmH [Acidobacteriaceae bacterium]